MAHRSVHQEIDYGQRVAIFGAGLIKVGEISTKPLFVAFLDQDNIFQPVRVLDFADRLGLEELLDFFLDCLLSFRDHSPSFLLDRAEVRANVEPV